MRAGIGNFSKRDIEWNCSESQWSGNSRLSRTWWDCSRSNKRHEEAGDPSPSPIRKHPRIKFLSIFFPFLQKALMRFNTSWTYLLEAKPAFIDGDVNGMETSQQTNWHHVFSHLHLAVWKGSIYEWTGIQTRKTSNKKVTQKPSTVQIWLTFFSVFFNLFNVEEASLLASASS